MFRTVEHQADIAIEMTAPNRLDLFRSALDAVIALLTLPEDKDDNIIPELIDNSALASPKNNSNIFDFATNGFDDEELLIRLLNEFLFLCQVEKRFPIKIIDIKFTSEHQLVVAFCFCQIDSQNQFAREFKAATYNDLKIEKSPEWHAKVVLDV